MNEHPTTATSDLPRHGQGPRVAIFVDATGRYGRGVLEGIADYVETHGPWSLFVDSRATGRIEPGLLKTWQGDGVLAFIEDRAIARQLARLRIPIVEMYGHVADLNLPWVGNHDEAIGRVAAEHLLERRLTNFAYSGYPRQVWSQRRREGFSKTLGEHGWHCAAYEFPREFPTLSAWDAAQRELAAWLAAQPKPLGVMGCSDRHARELLNACRLIGLRVPDEVAVIGSGNDEVICRLCDPPLSSVADNPQRIGYEAARLLDALMADRHGTPQGPVVVDPIGAVARRSTDVFAIDDKQIVDVLRFIRDHGCEKIDVPDVVRQVPMSRASLYRRFRKAVGCSIHQEILRVRLERVRELLALTALSQERIAALAGFEHPEYMIAAFKRHVHLTPGQYRARHRAGATGTRVPLWHCRNMAQ